MHPTTRFSASASLTVVGLLVALAACSPAAADGTVTVTASDYGFDVPEEVAGGAELHLTNASDAEFHEMVVLRLSDDEQRSVDELLQLPPDEAMASMTFIGVAGAEPGMDGELVDGTLTVREPGRYVLTCFIPEGADPDATADSFFGPQDGAPPDLGDGTPHAMIGMVREFTVTG